LVAERAGYILRSLGYSEREQELAKIAGIMHDIGNAINRKGHAELGAILANDILKSTDMPMEDRICVIAAIGNHDESTGGAKDPVSAALILADKTDVRRNRVRSDPEKFDIHDRVNYAVAQSEVLIDSENEDTITLALTIDTQVCAVMDYFEIFLHRMVLCRKAAEFLKLRFHLEINGQILL
jgi:metal-dependent HD superfamily phosphatase/phosphodiesterase